MTQHTLHRFVAVVGATCLLLGFAPRGVRAQAPLPGEKDKILRVCADPNNLPLSSENREGFENKIAELFAKELGWGLDFTWFPQRMGWVRNTLRAPVPEEKRFKCDIIMGVPEDFDQAATSVHYFRSTYAMAFLKGRGLDGIKTPDDLLKLPPEQLKKLRFGVFAQTPAVDWLLKKNLFDQAVPYQRMTGDPKQYPGEIVEKDLVDGKIDVAFAWGPIAGYFGKNAKGANIAVVPFSPDPEIKFDYAIAMGVRRGEKEWLETVNKLIEKNRTQIEQILLDYGVPLIDDKGQFVRTAGAGYHAPRPALPKGPAPYTVVDGKVDKSTYIGWRIFHSTCVTCHGTGATGTERGPNLLPRVRMMDLGQFSGVVLRRYGATLASGEAARETGAREALIEQIAAGKNRGEIPMPAWEDDPNVKPAIVDLYAYLRARADGAIPAQRPELMK
jgi:quinoprotein dehydrogenase-associated probable ABC transporter substrate-binding protein